MLCVDERTEHYSVNLLHFVSYFQSWELKPIAMSTTTSLSDPDEYQESNSEVSSTWFWRSMIIVKGESSDQPMRKPETRLFWSDGHVMGQQYEGLQAPEFNAVEAGYLADDEVSGSLEPHHCPCFRLTLRMTQESVSSQDKPPSHVPARCRAACSTVIPMDLRNVLFCEISHICKFIVPTRWEWLFLVTDIFD